MFHVTPHTLRAGIELPRTLPRRYGFASSAEVDITHAVLDALGRAQLQIGTSLVPHLTYMLVSAKHNEARHAHRALRSCLRNHWGAHHLNGMVALSVVAPRQLVAGGFVSIAVAHLPGARVVPLRSWQEVAACGREGGGSATALLFCDAHIAERDVRWAQRRLERYCERFHRCVGGLVPTFQNQPGMWVMNGAREEGEKGAEEQESCGEVAGVGFWGGGVEVDVSVVPPYVSSPVTEESDTGESPQKSVECIVTKVDTQVVEDPEAKLVSVLTSSNTGENMPASFSEMPVIAELDGIPSLQRLQNLFPEALPGDVYAKILDPISHTQYLWGSRMPGSPDSVLCLQPLPSTYGKTINAGSRIILGTVSKQTDAHNWAGEILKAARSRAKKDQYGFIISSDAAEETMKNDTRKQAEPFSLSKGGKNSDVKSDAQLHGVKNNVEEKNSISPSGKGARDDVTQAFTNENRLWLSFSNKSMDDVHSCSSQWNLAIRCLIGGPADDRDENKLDRAAVINKMLYRGHISNPGGVKSSCLFTPGQIGPLVSGGLGDSLTFLHTRASVTACIS